LILRGKWEIAYPLARRAYESLSLLVGCYLEPRLAKRWVTGKEILNSEVRGVLAKHPFGGEPEEKTRELYRFFAGFFASEPQDDGSTAPRRWQRICLRFCREARSCDVSGLCAEDLEYVGFWFGAVVRWIYLPVLGDVEPTLKESYDAAAKAANEVASCLSEQFNRTLAQEKAELIHDRRRAAEQSNGGAGDNGSSAKR
jgi:hypothetical protein